MHPSLQSNRSASWQTPSASCCHTPNTENEVCRKKYTQLSYSLPLRGHQTLNINTSREHSLKKPHTHAFTSWHQLCTFTRSAYKMLATRKHTQDAVYVRSHIPTRLHTLQTPKTQEKKLSLSARAYRQTHTSTSTSRNNAPADRKRAPLTAEW